MIARSFYLKVKIDYVIIIKLINVYQPALVNDPNLVLALGFSLYDMVCGFNNFAGNCTKAGENCSSSSCKEKRDEIL